MKLIKMLSQSSGFVFMLLSLFVSLSAATKVCCDIPTKEGRCFLECPEGSVMSSIDFASYGTPTGSCKTGFKHGDCVARDSLLLVQNECLGQNSCNTLANSFVFKEDPCPGIDKRLQVLATCDDEPTSTADPAAPAAPPSGDVPLYCELDAKSGRCILSCPADHTITKINFASFGTPTGSPETGFKLGSCHSEKSEKIVSSECLNKSDCNFLVNTYIFGDPCFGVEKSIAVSVLCTQN